MMIYATVLTLSQKLPKTKKSGETCDSFSEGKWRMGLNQVFGFVLPPLLRVVTNKPVILEKEMIYANSKAC
jgi:hypothetical protein